jgi:hypothetical protein
VNDGVGQKAIDYLHSRDTELDPGLSATEFERIETTFGFRFAVEHRAMLAIRTGHAGATALTPH